MRKLQRQETAKTTTLERKEPSILDDLLAKPLRMIQPKVPTVPKVKKVVQPIPPKKGKVILCNTCGELKCPLTVTIFE